MSPAEPAHPGGGQTAEQATWVRTLDPTGGLEEYGRKLSQRFRDGRCGLDQATMMFDRRARIIFNRRRLAAELSAKAASPGLLCGTVGCTRKHHARGLCNPCYRRSIYGKSGVKTPRKGRGDVSAN